MLTLVFEQEPAALPDANAREICVWRDNSGATFARAFARDGWRWIEWHGLGVFTFSLGSTTVHARAATSVRESVVADAFARVIQPIILQALGRQALHASAVLGTEGVIAFCGVGRSGKSTLAYALGHQGYRQVADDALVIEPAGFHIRAHLLPFIPGLREPSRHHFDDQQTAVHSKVPVADAAPATLQNAPLRAVFLLRQSGSLSEPERPQRVSPVQAFSALVTHARCFDEADASHTRRLIDDYLLVAERVPVFSIDYPPRFVQLPWLLGVVKTVARDLGVAELSAARQPVAIE